MKISITDFLTPAEIERALALWKGTRLGRSGYAALIEKEIILPNIERINKKLGQKCLPMYLAYLVEYVIGKVHGGVSEG